MKYRLFPILLTIVSLLLFTSNTEAGQLNEIDKLIKKYGKDLIQDAISDKQNSITIQVDNELRTFFGAADTKYINKYTISHDLHRMGMSVKQLEQLVKVEETERQTMVRQTEQGTERQTMVRQAEQGTERQTMVRQAERQAPFASPRYTPKKQTGPGPFGTLMILFFWCAVLYGAWRIVSRGTSLIKRHVPPIWIIANSSLIGMLDSKQYHELEALRKEFQISRKHFPLLVYTSSNLGTKIIKRDYKSLKKLYPNQNDKYILAKLLYNDIMLDPDLYIDEDKILEIIDQSMEFINTLDELCAFISHQEHSKNPDFYDSVLGQRIEEIIGADK